MPEQRSPESKTTVLLETPPGRGGLAVLRLQGLKADDILRRCGVPVSAGKLGRLRLVELQDRRTEPAQTVDEVLLTRVRDHCFELGVHGGPGVVATVLSLFEALGASRQDSAVGLLCDTEDGLTRQATSDLAKAHTDAASRVLLMALNGTLTAELRSLEAGRWQRLVADCRWSIPLFEVPQVALMGAPNAGKSTLFNALLGEQRVITSSQAGTTRDVIEETAVLEGFPVRLLDTAGLRESQDVLEEQGMEMGLDLARQSDWLVLVRDGSCSEMDLGASDLVLSEQARGCLVINKSDALELESREAWQDFASGHERPVFLLSAKTGEGLAEFRRFLRSQLFPGAPLEVERPVLWTRRQERLLAVALASLEAGTRPMAEEQVSELLECEG